MTDEFLVKKEMRFLGDSREDYSGIQALRRPQRIGTEESQNAN